jgi:signal peptidase II
MTADAPDAAAPGAQTAPSKPPAAPQARRTVPATTAIVAATILAVDQLTKRWALSELSGRSPRHVLWTLQMNVTRNSGMAFSQAQGIGPLIGILALGVVVWLAWSTRNLTSRITAVAAGLIAGGALGNLADRVFRGGRVLHGAVVDFIDFQWFPIFNVADMAIDIGGAVFVLWSLFGRRDKAST